MTSDQTHNQSPEPNVTDDKNPVSPPYFAYVGINEAARLAGKAKQQIYRDIEAGKLSWNFDTPGKKLLQVADLDRLYKVKPKSETGNVTETQNHKLPHHTDDVTISKTIETAIELARLQERLTAKEEALRKAEEQIRDLQENRDRLLDQTTRLTMLLTASAAPAQSEPAAQGEPKPIPMPWYKKIFQ